MKKYKQNPKIAISLNTKNKLDKLGNKGDSYEDVIKRLIKEIIKKENRQ